MNIKKLFNYFWILPFISFLAGYCIPYYFLPKNEVIVPNITGKSLQDCIKILTEKRLSLSLLKELEDPELPQGIILSQNPGPGHKIKKNHNIFVIISKKPQCLKIPIFFNQTYKQINKEAMKLVIKPNFYWINSIYSVNTCIAQSPLPNQILDNKELTIYLSSGESYFYVVPNLKGCLISKIYNYLDKDKINLEIFYRNEKLELNHLQGYKIVDQKPTAGSIIDLSKKLYLQVQVI